MKSAGVDVIATKVDFTGFAYHLLDFVSYLVIEFVDILVECFLKRTVPTTFLKKKVLTVFAEKCHKSVTFLYFRGDF